MREIERGRHHRAFRIETKRAPASQLFAAGPLAGQIAPVKSDEGFGEARVDDATPAYSRSVLLLARIRLKKFLAAGVPREGDVAVG